MRPARRMHWGIHEFLNEPAFSNHVGFPSASRTLLSPITVAWTSDESSVLFFSLFLFLFFSLAHLFCSSKPYSFILCGVCVTGPLRYYRNWSLSAAKLSRIKQRARAYLEIKHGARPHRKRYFVYERNYLRVYEEYTRTLYIGCLSAGKHLLHTCKQNRWNRSCAIEQHGNVVSE